MTNTLIITSALHPVFEAPGVREVELGDRLFQLCCSVLSWCTEPVVNNIIVCDNTDPQIDFTPLKMLMESHYLLMICLDLFMMCLVMENKELHLEL